MVHAPPLIWIQLMLVFTTLVHSGCRAVDSSTQKKTPDEIAVEKLGKNYRAISNTSSTHVLYIQNRDDDHINRKLKFIVVRVDNSEIVHQGVYQAGAVKWIADDTIEVESSTSAKDQAGSKKTIKINSNEQ